MKDFIQQDLYDEKINFADFFHFFWRFRRFLLFVMVVSAIVSTFFSLRIPNQYVSTVVLAPSSQETNGLGSSFLQLNAIGALGGFGSPDVSDSSIAIEIMKSWKFTVDFIEENNLHYMVYAASGWNEADNSLVFNVDSYNVNTNQWIIEAGDGGLRGPTSWELYERFSELLTISSDPSSGLITLSIEFYSPYLAKEWVDLYLKAINKHMQLRELVRVNTNIDYLENQAAKNSIAEMDGVLFKVIERQIKSKMLAEANPDYTFLIVNPSMVAEKKSSPKRLLMVILSAVTGMILAILFVVTIYSFKIKLKIFGKVILG